MGTCLCAVTGIKWPEFGELVKINLYALELLVLHNRSHGGGKY